MNSGMCSFPGCDKYHHENKYKLCRKHEEMLRFFIWMLNNVKIEEESKTKSGLILPH